jgi:hypothetical protein
MTMRHGDAERIYDWLVVLGLNPVPWQFTVLARMEQQAIDETFNEMVSSGDHP